MISSVFHRTDLGVSVALSMACLITWSGAAWGQELEGPVLQENDTRRVLILPTRSVEEHGMDSATFDVLMASAFREIGFEIVEEKQVTQQFHVTTPGLDEAREAYLDMRLEDALAKATEVRDAHLEHSGDLLSDDDLIEAELLMVQLILDRGAVTEARDLAVEILLRRPELKLDPVNYSPAMQALWLAAIERRAGRQPSEPDVERLRKFGASLGLEWVAVAVRKRTKGDKNWLVVLLVPTDKEEEPSRHPVALGTHAEWPSEIRQALEERFPPPAVLTGPVFPPGGQPEADEGDKEKKWYKSWWFWTLVGVAVAGGTAAAVVAANRDGNENSSVKSDPWGISPQASP